MKQWDEIEVKVEEVVEGMEVEVMVVKMRVVVVLMVEVMVLMVVAVMVLMVVAVKE